MAEDKKDETKEVKTGWQIIEFTKDFGTYKKGDQETYHTSSTKKLVGGKSPVAKVVKDIKKYVPKKAVL